MTVEYIRNAELFEPALQIISLCTRPVEHGKRRIGLPRFVHFNDFFRDIIRELFLHVGHETRFLFESVIFLVVRQKRKVRSDIRFVERDRRPAFVSAFIDIAGDGIFRVQRFIRCAQRLRKERGCAVFVRVVIACFIKAAENLIKARKQFRKRSVIVHHTEFRFVFAAGKVALQFIEHRHVGSAEFIDRLFFIADKK